MFVQSIDPRFLAALAASFRARQRECVEAAEEMRLSLRPWAMKALMEQAERWSAKAQSCEAFIRATAAPAPLPCCPECGRAHGPDTRCDDEAEAEQLECDVAAGRASW